jgi:hypothetical protein
MVVGATAVKSFKMKTSTTTITISSYNVFEKFLNLLLFDRFELPELQDGYYPLTDFSQMYNQTMFEGAMMCPNVGIQHFTNAVATFFIESNAEDRTNLFNCYMHSHARSVINIINDNQNPSYLGLSKYKFTNFTVEDLEFATVVRSEDTPQVLSFLFNHFADFYFEVKIDGQNISVDNYQNLLKKYIRNTEVEKVLENSELLLFAKRSKPLTSFTDDDIKNYQLACYIPIKQRKKL